MASVVTVEGYLATLPEAARAALQEVRSALREALPHAEEVMSYQIPTLRVDGANVAHFAGFKAHWSMFPASDAVLAEPGGELTPFLSGRATLRFALAGPVPSALVQRVALARAREVAAVRGREKPAAQRAG